MNSNIDFMKKNKELYIFTIFMSLILLSNITILFISSFERDNTDIKTIARKSRIESGIVV
jgi:hypothetical protein